MNLNSIKRFCAIASLSLGLSSSASLLALNVNCGNISIPKEIDKVNGQYVFSLKQKCRVEGEVTINKEKIESVFPKLLKEDRTYRKIKVEKEGRYENKPAVHLDVVQEKETKHGEMKLTGDIHLTYNEESKTFGYYYQSREIEGSGYAGNTKEMADSVIVTKQENHLEMSITRTVKIKKPWLAPKKLFIKETKKGLESDLPALVSMQVEFLERDQ